MDWDKKIKLCSDFFEKTKNVNFDIKLQCLIITDFEKFYRSHLSFVENNKNNETYLPYLTRLIDVMNFIINQKK